MKIKLLTFILISALAFSACGANIENGSNNPGLSSETGSFIPTPQGNTDIFRAMSESSSTDLYILELMTGTLLEADPEADPGSFRFIGGLAEGLPSISGDGLVWTYRIREGLKFSDGSVLDALSFVNSMKLWLDPEKAYPSANRFWSAVKIEGAKAYAGGEPGITWEDVGVKAANRLTLQFTLEAPAADAVGLNGLNIPVVHPSVASAVNDFGAYIASGAYKPVKYSPGRNIHMERNLLYPNAYKQAEKDIELAFSDGAAPSSNPSGTWFIYINSENMGNPPLMDENLRKALYYGLDRENVISQAVPDAKPTGSFVPQDAWTGDPFGGAMLSYETVNQSNGLGYDPAMALEYFDRAWVLNGGNKITVTIKCFEEEEFWGKLAIVVRDCWMELFGPDRFHLLLELSPAEETYLSYENGEYELGIGSMTSDPFDPWASMAVWSSSYPGKLDNYYNNDFDRLQYRSAFGDVLNDHAGKINALSEMDAMLIDFVPAIPLFY